MDIPRNLQPTGSAGGGAGSREPSHGVRQRDASDWPVMQYAGGMFFRLFRLFRRNATPRGNSKHIELPRLPREQIAHLLVMNEGLPQLDWGMADAWMAHETSKDGSQHSATELRRAIAAAWLDEVRDALTTDSRRWRSALVEGLAPLEGNVAQRVATCAEKSLMIIGEALKEIRGDPRTNPIPAIGIVAPATHDEYYSFISHFYDDEGEFATSGGIYIRSPPNGFPLIAVNAQAQWGVEHTIAHELTHHALTPDRPELANGLPLWAEEGLTQMMEEHVTRDALFAFNHEMIERHRALWEDIGFDGFASGETFHSPVGEEQELSYNLAQSLTRWLAESRRTDFFAFARACRNTGQDHEMAAREHLGATVQELAEDMIWKQRR